MVGEPPDAPRFGAGGEDWRTPENAPKYDPRDYGVGFEWTRREVMVIRAIANVVHVTRYHLEDLSPIERSRLAVQTREVGRLYRSHFEELPRDWQWAALADARQLATYTECNHDRRQR